MQGLGADSKRYRGVTITPGCMPPRGRKGGEGGGGDGGGVILRKHRTNFMEYQTLCARVRKFRMYTPAPLNVHDCIAVKTQREQ